MVSEGATVIDAGQVGTEMLYWLVGSRELDGGLMCTASHNPKAYTGAKLVKQGAIALSGGAIFDPWAWHFRHPLGISLTIAATFGCFPFSVTPFGAAGCNRATSFGSTFTVQLLMSLLIGVGMPARFTWQSTHPLG